MKYATDLEVHVTGGDIAVRIRRDIPWRDLTIRAKMEMRELKFINFGMVMLTGIVHVSAKDLATNKEQRITVKGGTGLSKEEIDRMVKEAQAHAEEDRRKREEIEARNQLDGLIYTAEKLVKDAGGKVSQDLLDGLNKTIEEVKSSDKSDLDKIKELTNKLNDAIYKVSTELYAKASAQQTSTESPPENQQQDSNGGKNEGTIDTDYKVQ